MQLLRQRMLNSTSCERHVLFTLPLASHFKICRYLRFSIDGKFVINFNQVAAYTQSVDRRFPAKRSVIISQGERQTSAASKFPEAVVANPRLNPPIFPVAQQCQHLGDCLEAIHARTSRLVQKPPTTSDPKAYFYTLTAGADKTAYDNEVLLEPVFTALPTMENLVSLLIPFSVPMTITSSLGLGLQNRWIPDET